LCYKIVIFFLNTVDRNGFKIGKSHKNQNIKNEFYFRRIMVMTRAWNQESSLSEGLSSLTCGLDVVAIPTVSR
jgi:hypothetical protein